MFLCPKCGGLFSKLQPTGALGDQDLYNPDDLHLFGCLCYYDLVSLERAVSSFEDRLRGDLSERFPGKKMGDIQREIGKMDRHSPLRVALTKRLQVLRRAKEVMGKLSKEEIDADEQEKIHSDLVEQSVTGQPMSSYDWIERFTK